MIRDIIVGYFDSELIKDMPFEKTPEETMTRKNIMRISKENSSHTRVRWMARSLAMSNITLL